MKASTQIVKNTFWTAANLVTYPLVMIAATPLFVKGLGTEQYGLWMLINVVVQAMNILNFGVGENTIKEIAACNAISNAKGMNRSFNRNLSLSILLAIASLLSGMLLAGYIEKFNMFNIDHVKMPYAKKVLVLFSLSTGFKFIEVVFVSVFKGLQKFDVAARLLMGSRLSVILASIAVVYGGGGLSEIVEVTILCNVLNLIIQSIIVYRTTEITSILPLFKLHNLLVIGKSNGWYWLQSAIALIGFLSDRLIIGYVADLKTIAYYSIAALVGSQIHNVLLAFGGFIFPKISANTALNKDSKQLYFNARFLIVAAGWGIIIPLILFGDFIFIHWLGYETYLNARSYIKLYLVFSAIILLIIIPFHYLNGSYYLKFNSLFEGILRAMHIVAMLVAHYFWGMTGLLWALILVTTINIPFQYFIFNKKVFKINSLWQAFLPVMPALPIMLMLLTDSFGLQFLLAISCIVFTWHIYFSVTTINLKLLRT